MVLISGCKSQKMGQLAEFLHTGCERGNFGLVKTSTSIYLANIPTLTDLKHPTCSLHCWDTSYWSFSGTQSCSRTDYSDNAEIVTLLLDRKSAGDYEKASGSDVPLQLSAAAQLILRRPRKCLPTTRHITPPAVGEGEKARMPNVWNMCVNLLSLHLCSENLPF